MNQFTGEVEVDIADDDTTKDYYLELYRINASGDDVQAVRNKDKFDPLSPIYDEITDDSDTQFPFFCGRIFLRVVVVDSDDKVTEASNITSVIIHPGSTEAVEFTVKAVD